MSRTRALQRGAALVVALAALGLATDAHAYVRSTTNNSGAPLRWMNSNCIVLRANSTGSDNISDGSDVKAIEQSVENWHKVISGCSYIRFKLEPATADAKIDFDRNGANESTFVFVEKGWQHDAQAAGITTVFFVDNKDSSQDGRILDADVELNGQFFKFTSTGAAGLSDVQNTVTHELGHVLGLDHPCDDGTRNPVPLDDAGNKLPKCGTAGVTKAMRDTTMFNFANPGETKKRTPEADDVRAVCEIYPTGADAPDRCVPINFDDSTGCSVAPRRASGLGDDSAPPAWPTGVALAAALAALALMSRRRRSDSARR